MDKNEAATLVNELRDFVRNGPGSSDEYLKRAQEILFQFQHDRDATPLMRVKAQSLAGWFDMWFSARKWQKYGDNGEHLAVILRQDISGLERGLTQGQPRR